MLVRYLVRRNLFLLFLCLALGTGIYLLIDIFSRIDDFLEAGLNAKLIAWYFIAKTPLIISQILPAVFFVALAVQLGLMARSREMLALQAGAIPFSRIIVFFIVYACIWSVFQLAFSQGLGARGEWEAKRVWREEVRKRQLDELKLKNVWFREGKYILSVAEIYPKYRSATGITICELDARIRSMARVIEAEHAAIEESGWRLYNPQILNTQSFEYTRLPESFLPIVQDMDALVAFYEVDNHALPLLRMGETIRELENSGANVEVLKTAWHGKISYAFSIVVLTLSGLVLFTFSENIYVNVGLALLLIFVQYGFLMLGLSAGRQAVLNPLLAAWIGNLLFGGLAGCLLFIRSSLYLQNILFRIRQIFIKPQSIER